jgi:outer membrane immunogenic protein
MEKIMTFALKGTLAAIASAALLAVPGQAAAADLGSLKDGPAEPFYKSWTGFYAGVNFGEGSGHATWQDRPFANAGFDQQGLGRVPHTDQSGAIYGGQIGYDWQINPKWVLGIEGSFSASDITGTDFDQFNVAWSLRNRVNWLASVTGRAGWLATDNVLLYTRAGVAFANNSLTVTDDTFIFKGQTSVDRVGFVVAPGIEWRFSPHVSVFLQGEYYGFSDKNINLTDTNPPPANANAKIQESIENLKFGVNYRF